MQPTESDGKLFQLFVALVANLIAITDGMTMGWTSPMIPYLLSNQTHIKMTRHEAEWIESCLPIGAIIGLPITAFFIHNIGRKKTLLLGAFFVIICWVLIVLSKVVGLLYLARVLNGIGLNMAFVSVPMYVGEIAQKDFRGFLSSNMFVMSLLGIVIMYSIGPYVAFYIPSIISVCLLVLQLAVFSFMPETPYYLILKNKEEEARKSLQKFRGSANIEDELKSIKKGIDIENKESEIGLKDIFLMKNYRKAVVIMLVVNSAQLFCAANIILMNLHAILKEAGSVYIDSKIAAIIFSVINLMAAVAASFMMDRLGRKLLMLVSGVITGICLLIIAVYFHLKHFQYDILPYSWVPIATIMIYAAGFKIGLGMVPIVLSGEIFGPKLKIIGITFADGVYVVTNLLSLQIYFGLRDAFGIHIPFYIFFCYAIFTCFFVIFYLPETKGRSLDEIQDILRGEKKDLTGEDNYVFNSHI